MQIGKKKHLLRRLHDGSKNSASSALDVAKSIHIELHPRRRAFINFSKGLIPGMVAGAVIGVRMGAHRMRPLS